MATEGERAHADAVINLCFEYIAGRCSATAHDSNLACEFSDAHALRVVTWNVNGLDQVSCLNVNMLKTLKHP